MAGSDSQPKKATPPRPAANGPGKPLQVMHISRKTEEEIVDKESSNRDISDQFKEKRFAEKVLAQKDLSKFCLLYTSPSPRDQRGSRMPSSA